MYVGGVNNIYNEKIEYETLYDDEMAILMHKSHPFADRGKISLRECRDEKFINLDSSTNLQKFISIMYEDARFDPNVVMICDYTLRDQMVIENYGISVTTKLSASNASLIKLPMLSLQSLHRDVNWGSHGKKTLFSRNPCSCFMILLKNTMKT